MYRRYSQTNGNAGSPTLMKRNRLRDLLILVLAGLLTASLVIGIPAVQRNNGIRSTYIQRIQTECDEAIRQTAQVNTAISIIIAQQIVMMSVVAASAASNSSH